MRLKKVPAPSRWRGLGYHPLSELIEFGAGIDLEGMVGHMQRNGYDKSEPIILYGRKILDGRHKHTAAQKAEVEPTFMEFVGTEEEAAEFVRKKILRQHLDTSQRAMIAAKLAELTAPPAAENQTNGEPQPSSSDGVAEAAESMNVSERTAWAAKAVEEKCTPAVKRAVRTGDVSVSDAAAVADLPKPEQDAALQAVRDKKAKTLQGAAGPKKPKKKDKPKADSTVPKGVQNILGDTWHEDCARVLSKLAKEAKSAFTWSVWLDGKVLDHLKAAEEFFLAAAPKQVCPRCGGKKQVDKKPCRQCRQSGYLAGQK